ncbi:probable RNA-directed DNA polymerase from transposon X-element [Trichonephila clavipes]|nr:probable RNA-directed DNA polymerase from transposon X-element [Trichonephila clavipes]
MLKNFPIKSILILTILIIKILKFIHFPYNWKEAIIFPINKPGKDPHLASSYRPISLPSTIGKLTESIILHRLENFINENNLLNPNQYGFTNKLSTLHPLLRLTEHISEGFQKKKSTGAVFLNIQKAFDRVWINGLTFKLISYKLNNMDVVIDSDQNNGNDEAVIQPKVRNSTQSHPNGDRPPKMVLKDLPSTTDIKTDLSNQGKTFWTVGAYAILALAATCPLLGIHSVEDQAHRSVTSAINFHHSSLNCETKTRCLKRGQEHRTSDCPIKEKIDNPECINCKTKGHMANYSQCPKFPKTKPKKGDALTDKNKNNPNDNRPTFNSTKTTPNISYANAAKNEQQMAAQNSVSESATNSSESNIEPKNQYSAPCSDTVAHTGIFQGVRGRKFTILVSSSF